MVEIAVNVHKRLTEQLRFRGHKIENGDCQQSHQIRIRWALQEDAYSELVCQTKRRSRKCNSGNQEEVSRYRRTTAEDTEGFRVSSL